MRKVTGSSPVWSTKFDLTKNATRAWLRIIDVPSGLSMWQKSEIAVGTHELNLASLELPYESRKISLAPGTYRLRLEVFVGGVGKTLAESLRQEIKGLFKG